MVAVARARWPSIIWPCLLVAVYFFGAVSAQSSSTTLASTSGSTASSASASKTSAAPTSLSLTTSFTTFATTIRSGNQNITVSTTLPLVYNVTVTANASAIASATANATATPTPITLDTRIDPAFGVLGALLILSGLPCVFWGHKNRWTSFFVIGLYTFALVCLVLILKFGVLQAVNPPSTTVRGLFMLACGVAGIAGGGIAIFFWQATRYFVGAWGGFVFAMWIQCFRAGGLISPIGLRWILYIICAAIGFILCTLPKLHYHILLLSTAFVGATAVILGIDCYTTGDLKEFYVWNLGFTALFPKFTGNGIKFPINQTMEIELGLIGALSLMGVAVQFRVLKVLHRKLKEIQAEAKRQNEEAERRAAVGLTGLEREKEEWEREHPTLTKHGRNQSGLSSLLLKDGDDRMTPSDERPGSSFSLAATPRQRYQSGVSEFLAAAPPSDELNRTANKLLQSPGALPVLDLGTDIENDVPKGYIADDDGYMSPRLTRNKTPTAAELEDLKRKEELLTEIQTIRKSIEVLKSETPDPSSSSGSRHPSFASRVTLGYDLTSPPTSHLRPPRQADPRARVQSMELSNLSRGSDIGGAQGRPTSVPLQDDWDSYVRERKLLQPPSGVTPPIGTTPLSPVPRVPISPAVEEALLMRQRRESTLSYHQAGGVTPELSPSAIPVQKMPSGIEVPVVLRGSHSRSHSAGGIPVTILPPKRAVVSPSPKQEEETVPWTTTRTLTFEELEERHREKIRQLQEPVTRAEQEQLQVQEAKIRWERAKAAEKQAVSKRQAEKAAAYSKEAGKPAKSGHPDASRRRSKPLQEQNGSQGRNRALSADILAAVPGAGSSSKRMSMLKVEDWQKHQQDVELGLRPEEAKSRRPSAVPFPEAPERSQDRRRNV